MGLFVYVILGTSKECSIGPTAVMSLMTFSYASEGGPIYSTLLAFLAGLLELVAGLLNLGICLRCLMQFYGLFI
jgi:sodium-independent sulfate anion transporter 11